MLQRKKKAFLAMLLTASLAALGGCGKNNTDVAQTQIADSPTQTTGETAQTGGTETPSETHVYDTSTLTVIASPGIHTQILGQAQQILAAEGVSLIIDSDFDDYMVPNWFVDGEIYDCNYYQHEEYLKTFNEEQDTDLVSVGKVHFEPLGIYPGTKTSLSDLTAGDVITIPRDTSNQARALALLQSAGIIGLPAGREADAAVGDVESNPYQVKLELMDASQVPSAVANSAFVVMNGNYARQALYTVTTDALYYEDATADVASRYANIVAVRRDRQDNPLVQRLVEVLQSEEIRRYIENTYAGAVVPYTGA